MSVTLAEFNQLTDAEQYFAFFDLPYDATIVNVNRLHILQKFSQLIQEIDIAELSETQILEQYRFAFQQAYSLFLTSNSLEQKLFKVFQKKSNNLVLLEDIGSE
ncbi:MAG: nitrogenase-stabilizing/protective protein NifW [Desertifilum sp.]|nr:nitrogenase-stabilizing/protective protein NifW [Desertifilum sp.]